MKKNKHLNHDLLHVSCFFFKLKILSWSNIIFFCKHPYFKIEKHFAIKKKVGSQARQCRVDHFWRHSSSRGLNGGSPPPSQKKSNFFCQILEPFTNANDDIFGIFFWTEYIYMNLFKILIWATYKVLNIFKMNIRILLMTNVQIFLKLCSLLLSSSKWDRILADMEPGNMRIMFVHDFHLPRVCSSIA